MTEGPHLLVAGQPHVPIQWRREGAYLIVVFDTEVYAYLPATTVWVDPESLESTRLRLFNTEVVWREGHLGEMTLTFMAQADVGT